MLYYTSRRTVIRKVSRRRRHLIIPDTQIKKGVPIVHAKWAGLAISEYKPDVVWHLGDNWDMPSLSTYEEKGSKTKEGARVEDDLEAGNAFMDLLEENISEESKPEEKIFLCGNHEQRIQRAINADPKWEGVISYDDFKLEERGWDFYEYQEVVWRDGIAFSHRFYYPKTGSSISGSIENRLNRIGCSFVQGHEQGLLYAPRDYPTGRTYHGLVAGSYYLHDEGYKGPQGNNHFRGIVVLNNVSNGNYSIMPLDIEYLCEKYERMSLAEYLRKESKKTRR